MQRSITIAKTILKTGAICLAIAAGSLLFVSYKAEKMYADLWQQLGLTKVDGTEKIKESFMYGDLKFYTARNIKKIAQGDRVSVAKELLAYTKQYMQGETFKKEYAAYRTAAKPVPPPPPKTEEQIRNKKIEEIKKGIAKTEHAIKTMKPEFKKIYEDNLVQQKKMLKEYEDPNNKTLKIMYQTELTNHEFKMTRYDKDRKQWEENIPENPLMLVKKRLQELLDVTKDVDFNAELIEKNGKKVFVNPAYERKNYNWKYAFRAGKDVTETVRAFAQQWISEIK